MATCPVCEKRGLFMRLRESGVCSRCDLTLTAVVAGSTRIIGDSVGFVSDSKNGDTRLSRCDLILGHLRRLSAYEERGVSTIRPVPSALIPRFNTLRRMAVFETWVAKGIDAERAGKRSQAAKHFTRAAAACTENTSTLPNRPTSELDSLLASYLVEHVERIQSAAKGVPTDRNNAAVRLVLLSDAFRRLAAANWDSEVRVVWMSSQDEFTCELCRAREGRGYTLDELLLELRGDFCLEHDEPSACRCCLVSPPDPSIRIV